MSFYKNAINSGCNSRSCNCWEILPCPAFGVGAGYTVFANGMGNIKNNRISYLVKFVKATRVNNKVVGRYKSSETVPISVSAVLPPEVYNALPASQK